MPFANAERLENLTEADLADLDADALLYVVLDPTATALSRAVALATLMDYVAAQVGADYIPLTQRAAANGVATLDAGGLLVTSQLPPLALGETFTVASQAAMLALTAQRGDMAIRTDLDPDGFFLLISDSPGTLADWKQILAPGSVVSVDGQTGVVTVIAQTITNGVTTSAPSQDVVFDALALKAPLASPTFTGDVVVPDADAATEAMNRQTSDARYAALALTIVADTGGTYTPVLTDSGKLVTLSDAGAIALTLPQDSDVAFAVGTQITFVQIGAGQVTVSAGTGATLNSPGPTNKFRAQWSTVTAVKRAANTWVIMGDLAAS